MMKEIQNTVNECVDMKMSGVLHHERCEHSERAGQLQFLLKESSELQKEKDNLRDRAKDLSFERDLLMNKLKKVTKESLTHKKVTAQLLTTSADN